MNAFEDSLLKSTPSVIIRKDLLSISAMAFAAVSLLAAFALRFDFALPPSQSHNLYVGLWVFVTAKGLMFSISGPHRSLWRLLGILDLLHLALACAVASAGACVMAWLLMGSSFPRSVYILDAMVFFMLMAGLVFSRRVYQELAA